MVRGRDATVQQAARAAADAGLLPGPVPTGVLKATLPVLCARAGPVTGHPGEMVRRDLGVLEQRVGGGLAAAHDALTRSRAISAGLPDSPINAWNPPDPRHPAKEMPFQGLKALEPGGPSLARTGSALNQP